MKIVSELACILFVFVQKMSGIFFGWWRILRSPVLPYCCVCRLVVVKESVLVASKIRWVSKRVKRLPEFW